MSKYQVDFSLVATKLHERGQSNEANAYLDIHWEMEDDHSNYRDCACVLIGILLLSVLAYAVPPFGNTLSWPNRFNLYWGSLLLLPTVVVPLASIAIAPLLLWHWTKKFSRWFASENITKEDLQQHGFDIIRKYDWRYDRILDHLGFGPREIDPNKDFSLEAEPRPELSTPWKFVEHWVVRREVLGVLVLTMVLLWHYELHPLARGVSLLVLLISFPFLIKETRLALSKGPDTSGIALFAAFLTRGMEHNWNISITGHEICAELLRAVKKGNAEKVRQTAALILNDVLAPLDKDRHEHAIRDLVIPALEEVFGRPLPDILQTAIEEWEPPTDS